MDVACYGEAGAKPFTHDNSSSATFLCLHTFCKYHAQSFLPKLVLLYFFDQLVSKHL